MCLVRVAHGHTPSHPLEIDAPPPPLPPWLAGLPLLSSKVPSPGLKDPLSVRLPNRQFHFCNWTAAQKPSKTVVARLARRRAAHRTRAGFHFVPPDRQP